MAATQSLTYNTPGTYTWVCPGGVTCLRLRGWGGGGGGGSGNSGTTSGTSWWTCGGGGGGGAMEYNVEVTVVPGTTYEIIIPAAAAGAASVANINSTTPVAGVSGSDGGTVVFKVQGGATLASFYGGMRGTGAVAISSGSTNFIFAPGGPATVNKILDNPFSNLRADSMGLLPTGPGMGGVGTTANGSISSAHRRGAKSLQGYEGGAGGELIVEVTPGIFTTNGNHTTWGDMGPGGGGGAGPGGPGGDGGYGDDVAFFNSPGGSAAAGSGAGGGGGAGGAQNAYPNNGNGGGGGNGGCGTCILTWTV